jgi:hydroxyethylthiazole kinase-like uncharacterized protein yjeF
MQTAHETGIAFELLTPEEMAGADRLAIAAGPHDGYGLMCNAGAAVAAEVLRRFPGAAGVDVLCGPGNNGGDGYVVARLLGEAGVAVRIFAQGEPRDGSDAARAAGDCPIAPGPLEGFEPSAGTLVVDALYGAGLARALDGPALAAARRCRDAGATVVAVDLPSGVSGAGGMNRERSFEAALTVTFFRLKPGHLLEPGRTACGETVVADIGIPASVLDEIEPRTFANQPGLWAGLFPRAARAQHKYSRGHAAVFSGGPTSTGAARLAALAAARIGAGAVTVLAPGNALAANAAHLTSIMLKRVDDGDGPEAVMGGHAPDALVLGPGYGLERAVRERVLALLGRMEHGALVLDADGITAFRDAPERLFDATKAAAAALVLTPHEGEFGRLFPDLAEAGERSRLDKAREAAEGAGAVVVLKGPDTVIAAPDGRAAINCNGSPWLATAGSGDVLAGLIAGLAAQKMPAFEAACAAVWLHAEAATRFGPGLIAEDLPGLMPPLLGELGDL